MVSVVSVLVITVTAFAKEKESSSTSSSPQGTEIDVSLVVASAPASGFDTGAGITFGLGTMLPQFDKNLQGRIEISYFSWSASEFGVDVTYSRIPVAVAARYYVPTQNRGLKFYFQGGVELSFDELEAGTPFGTRTTESDVHLGIVPGAGLDVNISKNLSFVTDIRAHIITDSYLTAQVGLAYHF